jgi:hypothetical protein
MVNSNGEFKWWIQMVLKVKWWIQMVNEFKVPNSNPDLHESEHK